MPDATDFILPGAGEAIKLFKSAKKLLVLGKVMDRVNSIGHVALAAAKKKRLAAGKSGNVAICVTNTVEKEGRLGHAPLGSQKVEDAVEDATKAKKKCWFGKFCFVAGTQVMMADGSLKVIEEVKVGDLVLSKDESSGEVAPKPVTKTFVRQAPATLAFTFSNGELIETTAEHPFFVQDKGFTPAGLVALGNSIVTRAGPGLQVTGIEKKSAAQTVYNFTVDEFHTYFVGQSGLWTHNMECDDVFAEAKKLETSDYKDGAGVAIWVPGYGLFTGVSRMGNAQWDQGIDAEVINSYNLVPENLRAAPNMHAKCAEVDALSKLTAAMRQQGHRLEDLPNLLPGQWGKSCAVDFRLNDNLTPKGGHLLPKDACNSCAEVFERLHIQDCAPIVRLFLDLP